MSPLQRDRSYGSNFSDEEGESAIVVQESQVREIIAVGKRQSACGSQKSAQDSNKRSTIKSQSSTPLEDLIRRKNELEQRDGGASSTCSKIMLTSKVSRRSPGGSPQMLFDQHRSMAAMQ